VRDKIIDHGGLLRKRGGLLRNHGILLRKRGVFLRNNDGLLRDTRAKRLHLPLLNARLLPLPPGAAAAARSSTALPHCQI
jgi:hypothetical protein